MTRRTARRLRRWAGGVLVDAVVLGAAAVLTVLAMWLGLGGQ